MDSTKNFDISLLVGLKNNLDYSKHFYETTRKIYPDVEICFVSFGSTDGTHEWLDSLNDENVKYHYSDKNKTFSDTFNRATLLATNKYVAYLHNDIVLSNTFLENLLPHLEKYDVVSYTTIEPPIFADSKRLGLVIQDFGVDIQTFDNEKFQVYSTKYVNEHRGQVNEGLVFFMGTQRETLISMGGLDNLFSPMFCEDDDLILRMKHRGLSMVTCKDAVCYHFVSKTSRFSEEFKERTRIIEWNSNKNFNRKWQSTTNQPLHNVVFKLDTTNDKLIQHVEPRVSGVVLPDMTAEQYKFNEQPNTPFDLSERVFSENNFPYKPDILVKVNLPYWNENSSYFIQNIQSVINRLFNVYNGDVEGKTFAIDCFSIHVNVWNPKEYQHNIHNSKFMECTND